MGQSVEEIETPEPVKAPVTEPVAPTEVPVEPVKTQEEIDLFVDKTLNFNDIQPNTLIVLKVNSPKINTNLVLALQSISTRYGKLCKDKNVSIILLDGTSNLETVNEERMDKLGWVKKEKKLIIT